LENELDELKNLNDQLKSKNEQLVSEIKEGTTDEQKYISQVQIKHFR
jgi:hypothetical protein